MGYITMNRFRVRDGAESEFEYAWLNRKILLNQVPGFVQFHLLRGPKRDDHTLYASHTTWQDEEAFRAWTDSDAFRQAHAKAGSVAIGFMGPPELESFEVLQTV